MTAQFVLAQISDCHVTAAPNCANAANLARALAAMAEFRPHAIIATGDLVNDEKPEEYVALHRCLAAAPAPFFLLMGNHDDRGALAAAFPNHSYLQQPGARSFTIDEFPVRLVALDDTIPHEVPGRFSPESAMWLDRALSRMPQTPTIVALHHPPFASLDLLFDTIGLIEGAEAFADIIARHPQVRRVICGHHHRAITAQIAHAPVFCAPSTAFPFGLSLHPDQKPARRTAEPPGFALHVFSATAGLVTHVVNF